MLSKIIISYFTDATRFPYYMSIQLKKVFLDLPKGTGKDWNI